jgi:hypothetical protein
VASTEYLAICHPERRKPIRFANRFSESKDPYYLCIEAGVARRIYRRSMPPRRKFPGEPLGRLNCKDPSTAVFRKNAKDKPSLRMANDD